MYVFHRIRNQLKHAKYVSYVELNPTNVFIGEAEKTYVFMGGTD